MWPDHRPGFLNLIVTILRVTEAKAIMLVPTFTEADHLNLWSPLESSKAPAPGLGRSAQLLGVTAQGAALGVMEKHLSPGEEREES